MLESARVTDVQRDELLESLDAGFALPSQWYTDQGLFERERLRVLRRGWHFGSHTGQLAQPGDQVLCQVAGVPVVLVAGDDGEIRGFVNICRHRAHLVVNEPGNRKTLQCLYHGWTYNLDGCLRRAPRAETELEFDPTQFGLIPVQTAVWGPMVWVNVDLDAPGFFDWIGGLPELLAAHGLDLDAQQYAFEGEWEISANWKVFVDNAIECYHCPTCHPALSQVLEIDPKFHKLSVGGRYWISHEVPYRQSASDVSDYYGMPAPTNGARPLYHFHWIFPTTYFQYKMWGSYAAGFDIGTVDVTDVDRIVFRHLVFLPTDLDADGFALRKARFDTNTTIPEDVAICSRVQKAHAAGATPPGRLLPGSEWLLQHFQRVIVEMATEPEPQSTA
jgi:choline monooxygenase